MFRGVLHGLFGVSMASWGLPLGLAELGGFDPTTLTLAFS